MRIGFLIGALNTGGAEKQLLDLAIGLVARHHEVEVAAYTSAGNLDSIAEKQGVRVVVMNGDSKGAKMKAVLHWKNQFAPDVLHGFMKRASALAVLSIFSGLKCKVVGSDYSTATYAPWKPDLWTALILLSKAQAVVTETEMNRRNLVRLAPWLRSKTLVIRNGADVQRFKPHPRKDHSAPFRFVAVSSIQRAKNPVRIVEACHLLHQKRGPVFCLDWYGRFGLSDKPSLEYQEATALVQKYQLRNIVNFHGQINDVEKAYANADALLHASIQDGIPNAVVEGMASGLPIVVSRISDLPLIVEEAKNGFVCNPADPSSIAAAMEQMADNSSESRAIMGENSRSLGIRWFARDRYIREHEELYQSVMQGKPK